MAQPPEDLPSQETPLSTEQYVEQPDGSVVVQFPELPARGDSKHYDNLAESLPESEMNKLSTYLVERIEADKKARERRDKVYKEGLERTGLDPSSPAPGGAQFDGASRTVHPMLVEACIDFAASAQRELLSPNGPVRIKIEGKMSQDKLVIAERQKNLLNWQLSDDVTEFTTELEQLLTQLPMGGSQYLKFWHDPLRKRWTCEFVPIDDIYLPYAATDFYTTQRLTHVQRLTRMTIEDRIESGFYREFNLGDSPNPELSEAGAASDKIEGRDSGDDNIDELRIVYEVRCWAKLSVDDDELLPYLVSIDDLSGKITAIYRNWEEDDDSHDSLEWIVEWGFLPWRGAYKIGLPHVIGTLSIAATGALRALLDSAHINNFPGGVVLKGAKLTGQTSQMDAGQFVEIEGPVGATDIRALAMPLPYNPPSNVLFQLLGWLDSAGKGVVTTAEEKISEASNQMPVGTALALIEQGAKIYSSIHARLHRSMRKCLEIIARLNRDHLDINRQKRGLGEVLATAGDFQNQLGVIPVSDPNIFSEGQRYAQLQLAMQLSQDQRVQYDAYELHKWALMLAKIPNQSLFLPEPKKPKEINAAVENMNLFMGQPSIAFPDQDHAAHIETHVRFLMDPTFVGDPQVILKTIPAAMEHVRQHLGFYYNNVIYNLVSKALGQDLGEYMTQMQKEDSPAIDRLIAIASRTAHDIISKQFEPLGPVFQQFLQQLQAVTPPSPVDPSTAMADASKMETQRRAARDQAENAIAMQESKRKDAETQASITSETLNDTIKKAELMLAQLKEAREQHESRARIAVDDVSSALAGQEQLFKQDLETAKLNGPQGGL